MKQNKIRFSLSRKITLMIMSVVMAVTILIFIVCNALYARRIKVYYYRQLQNVAFAISGFFQPDMVREWLEDGKPDGAYDYVYQTVGNIGRKFELSELSIFQVEKEGLRCIMDYDLSGIGEEDPCLLGDLEDRGGYDVVTNGWNMEKDEGLYYNYEDYFGMVYPIRSSDGEIYAFIEMGISDEETINFLNYVSASMFFLIFLIGLLFAAVPTLITSRKIAGPIRALANGAGQLVEEKSRSESAQTDIFKNIEVRSRDEVGMLYHSLSQMEQDFNIYTRDLISMTAENERIRTEMDLASSIQESQLPNVFPPFPDRREFDIYASMKPAKSVGGDFYDFFMVDPGHIALVMADVSGKGTPAALFMMISKMLIKSFAERGMSPAAVLENVNRQLMENNSAQMFVTVWLAVLDLSTGDGAAANAGHEFPIVRRRGGSYELVKRQHDIPVAVLGSFAFEEYTFHLDPGDSLFVYTDGVTEARQYDGEFFGLDRLLAALNRETGAAPEMLIKNVMGELQTFIGDEEQFDDITMLSLCFKGC